MVLLALARHLLLGFMHKEENKDDDDDGYDDNDSDGNTDSDAYVGAATVLFFGLFLFGLTEGTKVGHIAVKARLKNPVSAAAIAVNEVAIIAFLTLINNTIAHDRGAGCIHGHAGTAAPRAVNRVGSIVAGILSKIAGAVVRNYINI